MNTIGRYQIAEKLGQGGMGVVYRAFDPLLQRTVAVKLIGAAVAATDDLWERFYREARAAGQLSHKNIITIHDLGEHEGQPFLAMEFLEGADLQVRMAGQAKMSLARKLDLAIDICEGIEYAHAHGVIHRDIKPANIFITDSGTTKILDFGLARLVTSELTRSHTLMGTINYMAPEQVRGERADHRADIFSTGVVLYEILGGRKAFEADSLGATLYKILQETPEPLPSIDANVPAELVAIVDRALTKNRDERYQQTHEMLSDLTAYRQQLTLMNSPTLGRPTTIITRGTSPPVSPTSTGLAAGPLSVIPSIPEPSRETKPERPAAAAFPWRVVTAVGALLLVALFVAWTMTRDSSPPPTVATAADPPPAAAAPPTATRLDPLTDRNVDQTGQLFGAASDLGRQVREPDSLEQENKAQAAATVNRHLTNARELFKAERFDDASRAAGEALAADPGNAEAKRLIDEGATRSRGKGVEEARTRMARAKTAADAATAQTLAATPYAAALAAERDASSLYKIGRMAEAMARFWEANGLFHSAEVAARTEATLRAERARPAPSEQKAEEPNPPPAPPPAAPVPAATDPPLPAPAPPLPSPTAPSAPASSSPPPTDPAPAAAPPSPEPALPAASPTSGVKELLDRYRAALESRSLESLRRLWPRLSGAQESAIRYEFQNATRIEVEIVNPETSVNGANATVSFTRRYQVVTVDKQRLRTETRTTMQLQRNGTGWIIDRITFEPVR